MAENSQPYVSASYHIEKEDLLLGIAKAAANKRIFRATLGNEYAIAKTETTLRIALVRARLGDTYPFLTPEQDAAVVLAFEKLFRWPHSHTHDVHGHHHHHGGGSCSKSGPIHNLVRRIEQKILAAIGGKRGHRIVAILLRGGALLFCPGDDIATISLQIYGSISGQADHAHHVEQAILPTPVTQQKTVLRRRVPLCN